jgi:hypothetical protein
MESKMLHFDTVLAPPHIDGSVANTPNGVSNVHFTRQ